MVPFLLVAIFSVILTLGMATESFYICEAGDEKVLGEYVRDSETKMDGVDVYSNVNELSIFRNKGFWYIGNLAPWPPETFYRCVEPENCAADEAVPPVPGKWSASKKFGQEPTPVISTTPCGASGEL